MSTKISQEVLKKELQAQKKRAEAIAFLNKHGDWVFLKIKAPLISYIPPIL